MNILTEKATKFFKEKHRTKIASTKGRKDKEGKSIQFLLTFEEYVTLYSEKSVYPSRSYVLSRIDDLGDYVIGNVFVQHSLDNLCDAAGKTTELDKKINQYCIEHNYSRRTVKSLLKRGALVL